MVGRKLNDHFPGADFNWFFIYLYPPAKICMELDLDNTYSHNDSRHHEQFFLSHRMHPAILVFESPDASGNSDFWVARCIRWLKKNGSRWRLSTV